LHSIKISIIFTKSIRRNIKNLEIMILKKQLLQEQDLELTNSQKDLIEVSMLKDKISIWLNGKIIKSTKSLKPIQEKLNFLTSL